MERISTYLTYEECTKSAEAIRKGIANIPDEKQLKAMRYVGRNIFDPLRQRVGGPLYASSFFRSKKLNSAIGGSKTSQHMDGEAIDIDCDLYGASDNKSLFYLIKEEFLFDQLIWEFGDQEHPDWVHVSLVDEAIEGRPNRQQILRAINDENDETKYIPFDYAA